MRYLAVLLLAALTALGLIAAGGCGSGGGASYEAPTFNGDSMPARVDSNMSEAVMSLLSNLSQNVGMSAPPLPMPSWGQPVIDPLTAAQPLALLGCTGDTQSGNVSGTWSWEECYDPGSPGTLQWTYSQNFSSWVHTSNITALTFTTYREGSITGSGESYQAGGADEREHSLTVTDYSYRTVGHLMGDQDWLMDGIAARSFSRVGGTETTGKVIDFAYNDYRDEEYWWIKQYRETEVRNLTDYTVELSGSYCAEGCVQFETLEDLTYVGSRATWPESGVIVIRGAGGAAAKFTFTGGGGGTKEYDEDGDGTYEIGPIPFT